MASRIRTNEGLNGSGGVAFDKATDASAPRAFTTKHTLITSVAVGVTTVSFNVWWPFMPLYVLDLGAKTDAEALFWVAVATTAQGIARLATGPLWGVLSDRVGRKMMLLRALYLSSLVGGAAAFAQEPWQLVFSLTLAGLFSGFNPAAIALVSVSVPESRLNRSLSMLTGAQYIGTTIGPAAGAILAVFVGFRWTIIVSAIIPILTGTLVAMFVPADSTPQSAPKKRDGSERRKVELEPFRWSIQFVIAIVMYFMLFVMNQLTRLVTPIAIRTIERSEEVQGHVGVAFSLGGLISAISVLLLAPYVFRPGQLRPVLAASFAVAAAGTVVMAFAGATSVYIIGFSIIALVLSAMTPAINTLIAANVSRARRGTAFGVAGSAQALATMVGPASAAIFAAVSLSGGLVGLAAVLLALGVFLLVALREPKLA